MRNPTEDNRYVDQYARDYALKIEHTRNPVTPAGVIAVRSMSKPIEINMKPAADYTVMCDLRGCTGLEFDHCNSAFSAKTSYAGMVHMSRPLESGQYIVESDHEILLVGLSASIVEDFAKEHRLEGDPFSLFYGHLRYHPTAAELMQMIWKYSESGQPQDQLVVDTSQLTLLALLSSFHQTGLQLADGRIDEGTLSQAVDYIESHLNEPLSVKQIASVVGIGSTTLARSFKRHFGVPLWRFVQMRRLERARQMLMEGSRPIAQIALETGFANQGHLTRSFRKEFGTTPGNFRNETN